jgi:hypothetical protein
MFTENTFLFFTLCLIGLELLNIYKGYFIFSFVNIFLLIMFNKKLKIILLNIFQVTMDIFIINIHLFYWIILISFLVFNIFYK